MNIMEKIEDSLVTFYQPIYSLKKKEVLGYEALSRFKWNKKIINYPELLKIMGDKISKADLDWICRKKAILNYHQKGKLLFINISADNIAESKNFKLGLTQKYLNEKCLSCAQVVLEITEAEKVHDKYALLDILKYYKSCNFKLALDDFGTGYNTIDMLLDLAEDIDYIKLPIQIIDSVSKSFVKYELVKTFREIAHSLGIKIICEGVEKEEDLKTLIDLGTDYIQGYLLDKEIPYYKLANNDENKYKKKIISFTPKKFNLLNNIKKWTHPLKVVSLKPNEKIGTLLQVVDKNCINDKYILLDTGGSKYIFNLWEFIKLRSNFIKFNLIWLRTIDWLIKNHQTISYHLLEDINSKQIFEIYELTSILEIALIFEKQNKEAIFIKDGENQYYYMQKEEVFEKLYKEVYKARIHINPLTGLPANLIIEQHIDNLLAKKVFFIVGYLDIDNFKAFNDAYGFIAGDNLIKRTAFFLNRILEENYKNKCFVGHIGGDDFVFTVEDNDIPLLRGILNNLINVLETSCLSFFNQKDLKRGYYISRDRYGKKRKFPLASFSLIVVRGDNKSTIHEISRKAAKIKKKAKSIPKSVLLFEEDLVASLAPASQSLPTQESAPNTLL